MGQPVRQASALARKGRVFHPKRERKKSLKVTQGHSKWQPWAWGMQVLINIPLVPFLRYSSSNNSVTVKSWLEIVQDRWIWRRSIDHIRLTIDLPLYKYHFRVVWRWIISWPWNLKNRSLKVIETGTIRKLWYGFLFAFLHHFRYKARFWSKITIFSYLACIQRPHYRVSVRILP